MTRPLGNEISAQLASSLLGGLRILAYHAVPDARAFEAQMAHLLDRYSLVTAEAVIRAWEGTSPLPRRAVWVTFDDGYADVIENAQPVLDRFGMKATLFVCPARFRGGAPFWWHVTDEAARQGVAVMEGGREWGGSGLTARLKTVPDHLRRSVVVKLEVVLGGVPAPPNAGVQQLRRWLGAGHSVGNHSWDHPCLDQCEPAEQARQVQEAHRWLASTLGISPRLFAYPNGNWAPSAERELEDLRYVIGLGFDHRRARIGDDGLRLSRLRVDSSVPVSRFRSIVSGVHPMLYRLRQAVRPVEADRPRRLP